MTGRERSLTAARTQSALIVEIRAAEGGDDAKSLVLEQASLYQRLAARNAVEIKVVERLPSMLTLRVSGKGVRRLFANEAGGHRWQRVPPNEKRGRVHTSTVTVAVLPEPTEVEVTIDPSDIEETVARGSGPGGQHRNKTDSCVTLRHRPSGIAVRCDASPSQGSNRQLAYETLRARLWAAESAARAGRVASDRKRQVGSGMRGDKRRTIRCQDGVVNDHLTGRRWRLRDYLRGEW